MKTTVIHLEGIESVLSPAGIEKRMCRHRGIHKVETNFMTGTATVYHDDSVTLADIKRCVAECGYTCSGECLPDHVCTPGDPPAATTAHAAHEMSAHAGHDTPALAERSGAGVSAHAGHAMPGAQRDEHAGHAMPPSPPTPLPQAREGQHAMPAAKPAKVDAHAGHDMAASAEAGEMAAMADAMHREMGHGGSMSMEAMVRDMRNRFLVAFILAIPIFLYSPLFTDVFKIQLPTPFGMSNQVLSFLLTTPAVLYGGWVFYIGAWRGLKNRTLNMAVLVSLSVLAGYLFSVAATFLFKGEVFYEAAALLLAFVLFGHWMEMRARSGASQAIQALLGLLDCVEIKRLVL